MDQHDVRWLQDLDVILRRFEIRVRTKTFIADRHLTIYDLVTHNNRFVRVDDFFRQTALHTVAREDYTILLEGCPLDEQLTTWPILQHTWRSYNYKRGCCLRNGV